MLHIRLAQPTERTVLDNILRQASLANPDDRHFLLAHPEVMVIDPSQLEAARVYVAETASQVVGFASVLAPTNASSEIDGVFVLPGQWRKGVGRALIGACIARAKSEGAGQLHAVVNPHAVSFYMSLGFTVSMRNAVNVQAGFAYDMSCNL